MIFLSRAEKDSSKISMSLSLYIALAILIFCTAPKLKLPIFSLANQQNLNRCKNQGKNKYLIETYNLEKDGLLNKIIGKYIDKYNHLPTILSSNIYIRLAFCCVHFLIQSICSN